MEQSILIRVILYIMFGHWVADFVLQPQWIGKNKWKDIRILLLHVFIYGVFFIAWLCLPIIFMQESINLDNFLFSMIGFTLMSAVLHGLVDFTTSKITHYLWEKQNVWAFFIAIGFDQFLHFAFLMWAMNIFLNKVIL